MTENPTGGETLTGLFLERASRLGARTALRSKRFGRWQPTSWIEWRDRALRGAAHLIAKGVVRGDRVAIFAATREEWAVADAAVLLAGAVSVPIYQTLVGDQATYILEDSGAKALFTEDAKYVERLLASAGGPEAVARLLSVVVFDGDASSLPESVRAVTATLRDVLASPATADVDARAASVEPADLATIMYTSGTTGPPKGVMLTHKNFAFETRALEKVFELDDRDEQLLFLPMAHIFAKMLLAMQMRVGYTTSFAESLAKAMDNAQEVNPTFMGCVPRLYEKIYAVAHEKAAQEGGIKQKVFAWAVDVGVRAARASREGKRVSRRLRIQHHYAKRLVLAKVKSAFGKRLRFAVSGGAPLSKELAEWFDGVGVTILEGYGLTETTAATNINVRGRTRFGTVGPALPGVEIKIAPDGEILMRGDNIMRGYFRREDETREAIDAEGFFHSGDIGVMDNDGLLRITDRKKDIIVTANGKNVAPQNLENLLKQSPWISQAMVHGDNRAYLVALITLNAESMARFARETGRTTNIATLADDAEVRARVQLEVDALNRKLSSYETIKKFVILPRDFAIDTGELTPTLKVKRKVVTDRYRDVLDSLYV